MARRRKHRLDPALGLGRSLGGRLRAAGHADAMITVAGYRVDPTQVLLVLLHHRVDGITALRATAAAAILLAGASRSSVRDGGLHRRRVVNRSLATAVPRRNAGVSAGATQ